MYDIAFVVLHYMAVDDTLECVDSIREFIDTNNYKIIVVDNASPDNSLNILKEKYVKYDDVVILINNTNLGFAKGNNVGYMYAKKTLNAKFIVLMNNDICIFQKYIFDNIYEAYNKYNFAVMGPMIITKDGKCTSNPNIGKIYTKKEIDNKIRYFKIRKITAKNNLIWKLGKFICKCTGCLSLKNKSSKKGDVKIVIRYNKTMENVKLHGSFMIFSKNYIEKFDGLDDRTFMYFEEDILYLMLKKNGLKSLYYPRIVVYHKEDSSTDSLITSKADKIKFISDNHIESLKIYKKILAEN